MKKFLLLIFFINTISIAQYTTPGTGISWNLDSLVVYSGGTVTGSFPNYIVANKITVSSLDEILVTPGSVLQFTNTISGFEVNGIFKCEGTADSIITFTSPTQDSLGFYDGLRFNANTMSNASIISYTYIEYAKFGMRVINASPTMTRSHIYKCGRGVQLSGSNSEISINKIERCYEYGILVNLDSNPLIEENEICFNNTQGTSAKNQVSIGLQGNNSPVIKNNIIYGGESIPTGAISLWVSGASSFSNAVIDGNIIFNNSFGMTMLSSSNGIINAVIKNNVIYNNNINPNTLISGSGINVNGSPTNQPVITRNEIYGNWWGVTIQNGTVVQPGPQPNLGNIENTDTTDDGMNIIYNNIQGSDVFDLYNNCTNDIWAQNNDWRVYDSLSIEQHIFHKADDPSHGLVKFIPFSGFIPVEVKSFTAKVIDNEVLLEWITATEQNNMGFEIQRLKDYPNGSLRDKITRLQDWEKVGFVEGKGTTTETQFYSFADRGLQPGLYSYRLKQIDFDGTFEYSSVIEIEIFAPGKFSLSQNYPNPFNPVTKIKYSIPTNVIVSETKNLFISLKVYDLPGREVATLVNEYKPAGSYEVEFDAAGLSSGIYFLKLTSGTFTEMKKMILMK
jgi:hypothetical protein